MRSGVTCGAMRYGVSCVVVAFLALWQAGEANDEHRLVSDLLQQYRKYSYHVARPVVNVTDQLTVKFGLALIRMQMDEETGTMTGEFWLRYEWKDAYLQWDPAAYSGIGHTRILPGDIGSENIWQPDIIFYNAQGLDVDRTALAVVSSDGSVLWIPRATITLKCDQGLPTQFHCYMKFGSWTYDGFKLNPAFYNDYEGVDMNDYIMSNRYRLVENVARKNVVHYPCCEEPYPELTFSLTFEDINIPKKKAV